jgi:hypothetical protein
MQYVFICNTLSHLYGNGRCTWKIYHLVCFFPETLYTYTFKRTNIVDTLDLRVVFVITWTLILDPGRRTLECYGCHVRRPRCNQCKRPHFQLFVYTRAAQFPAPLYIVCMAGMGKSVHHYPSDRNKPSPAAEVESRRCNPMMQNPASSVHRIQKPSPGYYNYPT